MIGTHSRYVVVGAGVHRLSTAWHLARELRVPDGMAFAADGRLFVATTVSQGVTVISPDGRS